MENLELLLIAAGLSMDAFAVAICQGLCMSRFRWRHAVVIALFFGGFQALMPLLGWLLGSQFASQILDFDHWIAFGLLGAIGGKMMHEAVSLEKRTGCAVNTALDYRQLLLMAIATSIDALAIGVTFAFLNIEIVPAILTIGCTTFVLSLAGVVVGNCFGARYKSRAELAGGILLVLLGVKILLEQAGVL